MRVMVVALFGHGWLRGERKWWVERTDMHYATLQWKPHFAIMIFWFEF